MADQRRADYPLAEYPWLEIRDWYQHQRAKADQGRFVINEVALLGQQTYLGLNPAERGLLHSIWLLRALTGANVPRQPAALRKALRLPAGRWLEPALKTLERRGWVIPRKTKRTGREQPTTNTGPTPEQHGTNTGPTPEQYHSNTGKKVRVAPDAKRGATLQTDSTDKTPPYPPPDCGYCAGKGTLNLPDKPGLISPCSCDRGRQIVATAEALHGEQGGSFQDCLRASVRGGEDDDRPDWEGS